MHHDDVSPLVNPYGRSKVVVILVHFHSLVEVRVIRSSTEGSMCLRPDDGPRGKAGRRDAASGGAGGMSVTTARPAPSDSAPRLPLACDLCGVLPVTPECSLIVPRLLMVDVPDPVTEEGPVNGKSTEGSEDEY